MNNFPEELRILVLEDVPAEAELEEIELREAGLAFTMKRVDTREAFERALDDYKPGIVLADCRLPGYNGRDALEYASRTHPHIPVIMVSGEIGDEAAVELLKLGARDYVLKGNLVKLAPAIQRALSEERSNQRRKLAEGRLRESEAKFRSITASAQDAILMMDNEGKIAYWNAAAEKIFGYSEQEALGQGLHTLLVPERYIDAYTRGFAHFRETGAGPIINRTIEMAALRRDGSEFPVELSLSALKLDGLWNAICILRDITGRKRAAQALLDSEARYKRITEGLTDYQYTVRIENGRAVETVQSPACVTVTGYTAEEFSANPMLWIQMVVPEDSELVRECVNQALAGKDIPPVEHRIIRKDGQIRWVSDTIILFKDAAGKLQSYDGVIRDITERKKSEAELLRLNRALQLLSKCNMALVHAASEPELLAEICRLTVEAGGYLMAWVGYAQDDAARTVRPVAESGYEQGYLDNIDIRWDGSEFGQGPTGAAIRTGQTVVNQNSQANPKMAPWREAAIKRGYESSIALPLPGNMHVLGALTIYSADPFAFGMEEMALLEELASDLAFGIETLRTRAAHEQQATLLRQSLEQSIQTIAGTVEARDPYTAGHQRRVAELATAIAGEMGLPEEQVRGIHLAATIHDLGKIHVPAEILAKPGKLSDIEMMLVKTHTQAGYNILKDVKFPWPIADIILQHHERLDGTGYPQGLKSGQILLESKIMAVADVVEAMSSHRPYRPGLGIAVALEEIEHGRADKFDPAVVDACLNLFAQKGFAFSG